MDSKILLGIVGLLIVAGGAVLLMGKPANKQTPPQQPSQESQPSVTLTPTNQASESATNDKMILDSTVTVNASGFSPDTLTVKIGTKVTWINKSGDVANVSSDPHPIHTIYPPLNLNNFNDRESVSLTFDKAGTYKYHNHLNPSQTGRVVVE